MNSLSKDVLCLIFADLTLRDLINFSECNKSHFELVKTKNYVYQLLFKKYFPQCNVDRQNQTRENFKKKYNQAICWKNVETKYIKKQLIADNFISIAKGDDGTIYLGSFFFYSFKF